MKNAALFLLLNIIAILGNAQTTATNFNCNDCSGTNHDLFTELDAGKIIVLVWVMPCATCIAPSRSAYDVVQTYSASHPGRVLFYLADDYADTPCNTLTSWANTNSMPNAVVFSNTIVDPSDYGAVGMPKIVVLGGSGHTVYYNEDNGNNLSGVKPAIDSALAATGISEISTDAANLSAYFNSGSNQISVSFMRNEMAQVSIRISDMAGKIIIDGNYDNTMQGENTVQICAGEMENGIYLLTLTQEDQTVTTKLLVTKQ